jgi:hypothetical protein
MSSRTPVESPGGASSQNPPESFPLPSTFPPGVDPATYREQEVGELLRRAAYFSLFSVHDPAIPNTMITTPSDPSNLVGLEVNENTHRFDVRVTLPTSGHGLQAVNVLGQVAARVRIHWMVIPDDFQAAPDRWPPPTPLDPTRSQRFTMMNGHFEFLDRDGSGMRGFGAGRTFPEMVGGQPRLRIGAAIEMLEGLGRLAGLHGSAVVNGYISPPQDLFINILLRVVDPEERLRTPWALSRLDPQPEPDASAVFMMFLGEEDTECPTTLTSAPDGTLTGSTVHELLRLVHIGFDLGVANEGLRSRTEVGHIVGRLDTSLIFNPLNPAIPGTSKSPIPYQTKGGVFTFFGGGDTLGTLSADIVEGRAFTTLLAGAPMPVYRFVGFGPFTGGTGELVNASGMLSMNGIVSVFPRTLSNLYVLRLANPDGRFRALMREVWG